MSVTLMIMGRRRPGQTLAAHRRHMADVHAPLVLDYIRRHPDKAPRRYVQNHVFDSAFASGDPSLAALARQHDFLTEVGFEDMAAAKASRETDHYRTHLRPDEANMVDEASVTGFPVARRLLADAPAGLARPVKLAVLFALAPGQDPDAALARWQALSDAFGRQAARSGGIGHEQGRVLVPGPVRAVDLFRLDGEEAARALARDYQDAVTGPLESDGSLPPGGHAMLFATEHVFFTGREMLPPVLQEEMS